MSDAALRTQLSGFAVGSAITKAAKGAWRETRTLFNAKRLLKTPQFILGPGRQNLRQAISRFTVPAGAKLAHQQQFADWLAPGEKLPAGVDSFYLRPDVWRSSKLSGMARRYPSSSGLKISKNIGDIYSPYMTRRSGRHLQRRLSGSHLDQVRTYNELYLRGIAPRLWDIVELVDADGAIRVGYVVDHVTGTPPKPEQFEKLVSHLRRLCSETEAVLVSGSGWRSVDFQLPDGNGNVITSAADGKPKYVDIHSFRIVGAQTQASFQDQGLASRMEGGGRELTVLTSALETWNLDFRGKLVVSVSDNPSLHIALFLDRGARWVHAFCEADESNGLERGALSEGHTRFSYSLLGKKKPFSQIVPEGGLRASDVVVHLSLADRPAHWQSIFNTPWSTLIVEHVLDGAPRFDATGPFSDELELLTETVAQDDRGLPVAISLFRRTASATREGAASRRPLPTTGPA